MLIPWQSCTFPWILKLLQIFKERYVGHCCHVSKTQVFYFSSNKTRRRAIDYWESWLIFWSSPPFVAFTEDLLCSVLISLKCYLLDKITVGLHELSVNIWKDLGRKFMSLFIMSTMAMHRNRKFKQGRFNYNVLNLLWICIIIILQNHTINQQR